MSRINELHEQAMDFADKAFIARRQANVELADVLYRQAFELESAAADLLKDNLSVEPTRSVLFRSAASLAIECGDFRAAERLIVTALAGNPPPEIADELRDILQQANFNDSWGRETADPARLAKIEHTWKKAADRWRRLNGYSPIYKRIRMPNKGLEPTP